MPDLHIQQMDTNNNACNGSGDLPSKLNKLELEENNNKPMSSPLPVVENKENDSPSDKTPKSPNPNQSESDVSEENDNGHDGHEGLVLSHQNIGDDEDEEYQNHDFHNLQSRWTMWFMNSDQKSSQRAQQLGLTDNNSWNQGLIELYTFGTVEDFWAVYNHIQLPAKLRVKNDYMVFREGVKPAWEDSNNSDGGMWKLILPNKMRNTDLDRLWLETLLSMIGEQYGPLGDYIMGAYLQRRQKEDRIQLWTNKAKDREQIEQIGRVLKSKLNLSSDSQIHYLKHEDPNAAAGTGKHQSWAKRKQSDSLYTV